MEQLPKKIEALEVELKKYQQELSRPNLYLTDRIAFTRAAEKLNFIKNELTNAEEEWLRLEILRNEIDQG